MMRAFRAVAAGPLSPGDYPALNSSSVAVRALVNDFVTKLDLIIDERAHAVARAISTWTPNFDPVHRIESVVDLKTSASCRAPEVMARKLSIVVGPTLKWGEVMLPRKRPPFPCLVPGCENVGAPIYGIVCVEHRKTPKRKIARLRADRSAARG